jgi:hypothetical protein
MFNAAQISLGQGQSWEDIKVFSHEDMKAKGLPLPFESRTMAFECRDCIYVVHVWNIISIKLDKEQRGGDGFGVDRIILSGDANYDNALVLSQENWVNKGIPYVLKTDDGITAQMVFSCVDGTFIILDQSVTSLIIKNPRPSLKAATQIIDTSVSRIKGANKPQTVHGNIKH